jgi:hypothetical protein
VLDSRKSSSPVPDWSKLPVIVIGVVTIKGSLLYTVPATILSPSAVLPPAKVRLPLPIAIVPPVQKPKVLPVPA